MIKESSNPQQNKDNFVKFPKGLCCGDDNQEDCKNVFAIPSGRTLKSVNIKNLFDDVTNVLLNPSLLEIEEAFVHAGYIVDGPSIFVSETAVEFVGSVKNVNITLDNDVVVEPVKLCTKTIVCDFVAPYTGGTTDIILNGDTFTIPVAGAPVYGTTTAAEVKAAIDALITPEVVTVVDNTTLGIYEVTYVGQKNTEFSIGGTDSDKCKCKKQYI